jgi:hypothetical protein
MACAFDTGELFDVEMDEFAWGGALVALDGRRRREQQAIAMTAEEARDDGFGEFGGPGDPEARELAEAQGEDAGDAKWMGGARRGLRPGRAVLQTGGTLRAEPGEPFRCSVPKMVRGVETCHHQNPYGTNTSRLRPHDGGGASGNPS